MNQYNNAVLSPACIGMLVDSSRYNVDGACVVKLGKKVYVGVAVVVDSVLPDGTKVVRNVEGVNDIPYGIAMFTQFANGVTKSNQGVPAYPYVDEGEAVPILTHGRIWALGYSVNAKYGNKVKFNLLGYVNNSGTVLSNWTFTEDNIPYIANNTRLIGVQVLQGANITPPPPVLVASATITASAATPSPNNAPVTCSVAVLPANATNKNGVWSADAASVATINASTGVLTPVGTVGNVVVTWTASDASGVTAQYTHRFEAPPAP